MKIQYANCYAYVWRIVTFVLPCTDSEIRRIIELVFTALHGMPARTSCEKGACLSVRPSVRHPSVCQTRDLWQNERKLCPYSHTTWKIINSSFVTRRIVDGDDPFYLKCWDKSDLEFSRLKSWSRDVSRPVFRSLGLGLGLGLGSLESRSRSWSWDLRQWRVQRAASILLKRLLSACYLCFCKTDI